MIETILALNANVMFDDQYHIELIKEPDAKTQS